MHKHRGTHLYKISLMALPAKLDTNTVIMGVLNTPLSPIDRSSRKKVQQRNFRATLHIRPNRYG
jgi:hypothetical protein